MSTGQTITRTLTRSPLIAVVLYVAVIGGLIAAAGLAVANILDHQRALAQTSDLLDQLQGRRARGAGASPLAAEHPGTPFLEGPTVTVAGATLLQRVAVAVSNVGGTIQSSQVDILGTQAKDGFSGLLVSSRWSSRRCRSSMTSRSACPSCSSSNRCQVPQTAGATRRWKNPSGSRGFRPVAGQPVGCRNALGLPHRPQPLTKPMTPIGSPVYLATPLPA